MLRRSFFVLVTLFASVAVAQTAEPAPAPAPAETAPAEKPSCCANKNCCGGSCTCGDKAAGEKSCCGADGCSCGHDCAHGECPMHHAPSDEQPGVGPPELRRSSQGFQLDLDGHLRLEFATIQGDRFFFIKTPSDARQRINPNVGRNDGFALGAARLNVRGTYGEKLYVRLGFDGAVPSRRDPANPVGQLSTGLKDAYLRYTAAPEAQIYAGRFKPPFDVEQLTPESDLLFVQRSLESRGVEPQEGFSQDEPGFDPGRQIGVMLAGPSLLTAGPVELGYGVAMTNGNDSDFALNDNDIPAFYGRVTGSWGQSKTRSTDEEGPATLDVEGGGQVGLSGFYNELTFGLAPNRFRDRQVGAGVDVSVQESVFDVRGQLLWSHTNHLTQGAATRPENALGGHIQLGIRIPDVGVTPAYRFAYYNPRWVTGDDSLADVGADFDMVMQHTVGVRYLPASVPMGFWLDYTRSIEQNGRSIPNDRIEAAMQVNFQ